MSALGRNDKKRKNEGFSTFTAPETFSQKEKKTLFEKCIYLGVKPSCFTFVSQFINYLTGGGIFFFAFLKPLVDPHIFGEVNSTDTGLPVVSTTAEFSKNENHL